MAKNTKSTKERRCRKNIATLLSLMGFHDDDPAATIKIMRQKLKKIQEKAKFKKPGSAVRKVIVKWAGKTTMVSLKPAASLFSDFNVVEQIADSRNTNNNINNNKINDASCSENYSSSSCLYNKKKMMMINNDVDRRHKDSARSFGKNKQLMKDVKVMPLKIRCHDNYMEVTDCKENNAISTSFDLMMVNDECANKELDDFIISIGGSDVKLVIEKELTKSDVTKGLGRLLIPPLQVKNSGFLTLDEKRKLEKGQDINAPVFDMERRESTINLTQWNMSKEMYALKTGWNNIVTTNGLEQGMVIQVWGFRVNEEQLCFALVRAGGFGN